LKIYEKRRTISVLGRWLLKQRLKFITRALPILENVKISGEEQWLHTSDKLKESLHVSAKTGSDTYCTRGWAGRAGRVRKISPPQGLDPYTFQAVMSRYNDYTILTHHGIIPLHTKLRQELTE
jgi:hypothetical protein